MLEKIRQYVSKLWSSLQKEAFVLETLHGEVRAAVHRMADLDPGLRQALDEAHAYAVFPSVGKATALLGCAFGKGEVFQGGGLVGYAGVAQLTLGVQLGGQTFSEIIVFENKASFDRFKAGRIAFAANASAVLVKAGAASSVDYERGAAVFVHADGGMMLEAALGAQKFFFQSAGMGKLKAAPKPEPAAAPRAPRAGAAKTGAGKPAAGKRRPSKSKASGTVRPAAKAAAKRAGAKRTASPQAAGTRKKARTTV